MREAWMRETDTQSMNNYHYPPAPEARMWGIYPTAVGDGRMKPNCESDQGSVPYYSIYVVFDGVAQLAFGDGRCVNLRQGDLFCLFPGRAHVCRQAPDERLLRMNWVNFQGEQAAELPNCLGVTPERPFLRSLWLPSLEPLFQQLKAAFQIRQEGANRLQIPIAFMKWVEELLRQNRNRLAQSDTGNAWLRHSIEFMESYYSNHIEVREVAARINIDRSHFTKMFAKRIGISPGKYLSNLRLNRGMQLLKESQLSISEIALTVGYHDPSSFTRSFRNKFGIAPREARLNHFR